MGFVHPQIKYSAAIWDPRPGVENNGAHKIEMAQRCAARWTLFNDTTTPQPFLACTLTLAGDQWSKGRQIQD